MGGASLALSLLFKNQVSAIYLNDLDPAIHAFWYSVLNHNDKFLARLAEVAITPAEWINQKNIYSQGISSGKFALGFATFYLNRTNHSGLLNGGMIGGRNQNGEWKIDARFNRIELHRRIERIGQFSDRIRLFNMDAIDFSQARYFPKNSVFYFDPPYYYAGNRLYLNSYKPSDHKAVSLRIQRLKYPWVLSYDDVSEIRSMYKTVKSRRLQLLHSARDARSGKEVLFFAPGLKVPSRLK